MSTPMTPALAHAAGADRAGLVAAARRALVPAHVGIAVVLGLAWGGANALGFWLSDGSHDPPQLALHFVFEALLPLLLLVPLLALADAITADTPQRVAPYVLAALAAAVGGEALFRTLAPLLGAGSCDCTMDQWPLGSRIANMLPDSLIICGFITAGYCYRKRASRRTARVRTAELDYARLTREMQEARLQAMQACIEPQFLFDTLGDVDRLQREDGKRAIQLIDDLIAYLRAALPHLNATNSTVGRECGLATAYVNIQRLRHDGRPAFEIAIVGDARDAHMPPMLLLPLVDCAVRASLRRADARALGVRVAVEGGLLRIALTAGHDVFTAGGEADEAIGAVRERLRAILGRAARLDVGATDTDSWLTVEMPHEHARMSPPPEPPA